MECDYAGISLDNIMNTRMFDFEEVATSAAWIHEIEQPVSEEEDEYEEEHHDHCECSHYGHHDHHCCHHHHHHEEGEAEEYGIQTFVYYRRKGFDLAKFDRFVATQWPGNVIRTKGVLYFNSNRDMSLLFEQAGVQKKLTQAGLWYAAAPEEELRAMMEQDPGLRRDWDEKYGDRMIKLVFIGQHLDKTAITEALDACLEKY